MTASSMHCFERVLDVRGILLGHSNGYTYIGRYRSLILRRKVGPVHAVYDLGWSRKESNSTPHVLLNIVLTALKATGLVVLV